MNPDFYKLRRWPKGRRPMEPYTTIFDKLETLVPKMLAEKLKQISEDRAIPISRLIAIAIDNEMDCDIPFKYPMDHPKKVPWKDGESYKYSDEGFKLTAFMNKFFPKGTSIDTLVLCRREIGILETDKLIATCTEMLSLDLLEEFRPTSTRYPYNRDYRRMRIVDEKVLEKRKEDKYGKA